MSAIPADRRMSRRNFVGRLGGAILGGQAVLAAGCGSSATGGGGGDGGASLRFAAWGDQADHEVKRRQIRLFQEANPGVTIRGEYSGIEDFFDKLATQAAGANAPDIFMINFGQLPEYADRGVLLDFQKQAAGVVQTSSFEEGILEPGRREGRLVALPLGFTAQPALVYDRRALQRAGAPVPEESLTWEGYAELVRGLAREGGRGSFGASDQSGDVFALEGFIRARGKELYDEQGELGFAPGDLAEWFAYWDGLRRTRGVPPRDVQEASSTIDFANSLLVKGSAPLLITPSSNGLRRVQSLTKSEVDLAPLPRASAGGRNPQVAAPIDFITASSRGKNPELAAQFIDFCLNDRRAAPLFGMSYGVPPSRAVAQAIEPDLEGPGKKNFDYVQRVSEDAEPRTAPPPGASEMGEVLTRAAADVGFRRRSAQEAARGFFDEAERVLSAS